VPELPEEPAEVARETARGRSARTPWLALGAVQLTIVGAVLVLLAIVGLVYALS
jgi:hypothetical protein